MVRKVLKNKPLVEAIFDLRWELQEAERGIKLDKHHRVLVGSIYEKVRTRYPYHEELPTASMPDEIAGYVVQHRFRRGKGQWPLVQVGPGIITLNDTEGYDWEDFEQRIHELVDGLYLVYPEPEKFRVSEVLLRYIDAVDFGYNKHNIFDFLKEKMNISIDMDAKFFENTSVGNLPLGIDLRFSFPCSAPKGEFRLRFVRGKRKDRDALIWETIVKSVGEDAPQARDRISAWIKGAHDLAVYGWFFKMIEGDLEKEFV